MRLFLLIIIASTLLFSLFIIKNQKIKSKNHQVEEQNLKIASLNAEIESITAKIEMEKENHIQTSLKLKDLSESLEDQYVDKKLINLFIDGLAQFLINKEEIIKHIIFNDLQLQSKDISSALFFSEVTWKNLEDYPEEFLTVEIYDKSHVIQYIWSIVDRGPDNLASLITESDKKFIYSLLKSSFTMDDDTEAYSIYQNCGMDAMVKGLIVVYHEFQEDEEKLLEVYDLVYSDDLYLDGNGIDELIVGKLATPQVKLILSDARYKYHYTTSELRNRLMYVYRFWARRHHEGNIEFVYNLLKELDENVSYYPISDDDLPSADNNQH